jgi:hypothetical protein
MKLKFKEFEHLKLSLNKVIVLKSATWSFGKALNIYNVRNTLTFIKLNTSTLTFTANKIEVSRNNGAFMTHID